MKVYLSPSNQYDNLYSYGNTNEMKQCNRIASSCEKYLLANGFEVKRAPEGQKMNTSINESNSWGADLHVCIHTNAGGGRGCEVYTSAGTSRQLKYAKPIYSEIAAITKSGDRGLKTANFAELTATTATAVYCECEFHDSTDTAKWITENTDALGKAIAKGICTGAGTSFKDTASAPQGDTPSGGSSGGELPKSDTPRDPVPITLNLLGEGDSGEDVRALQILLLGRGYAMGSYGADGSFGPATKAAVLKYQKDKAITADGLAGKETFTKLLGL